MLKIYIIEIFVIEKSAKDIFSNFEKHQLANLLLFLLPSL